MEFYLTPVEYNEQYLNLYNSIPRAQVIATLSTFRQEWQEAVNGKSLMETEGNLGLILADLVKDFGLTTHEQTLVLGPELFTEVRDVLSMPAHN